MATEFTPLEVILLTSLSDMNIQLKQDDETQEINAQAIYELFKHSSKNKKKSDK